MADTVAITAGSGTTIATDQVTIGGTAQHVQRVKLFDATDGSTNPATVHASGALKVQVNTGTVTLSGTPAVRVTSGTVLASGTLAHDAPATGNPLRIGVRARSSLSGYTAVATNDVTELHADVDGVLLTRQIPLSVNLTTRVVATTTAAAGFANLSATTLLRNYVTSVTVYNNGATSVFVNLLNGTTAANVFYSIGGPIKGHAYAAFDPPLRQASTNTALGYKISAAIGGSGVLISVTGYQSRL